jgi:hypothetical protein
MARTKEGRAIRATCDCGFAILYWFPFVFTYCPGKEPALYNHNIHIRREINVTFEQAQMILERPEAMQEIWEKVIQAIKR